MDKVKVTVVVPIYNVQSYLNRCIESIVNQTYKNLEILLIDDGSPDNCPQLCDEWAKKDSRIKVIHKKNEGLGMARNTGIDNATGEYICFIDSDDYIDLNMIEKTQSSIKKYDSDIVMFGMNCVDDSGKIISTKYPKTEKDFYSGNEILNYILPNMLGADTISGKKTQFNMSSSGILYSLNLINKNNWRFVSERKYISEDFYSLLDLFQYINSISIVHEAFYYYCYNESSLTHIFNSKRFENICICHKGMIDVCKKCKYSAKVKNSIHSQFLGSLIGTLKLIVFSELNNKAKKQEIKKIINDNYLQNILKNLDTKNEPLLRKILIAILKNKFASLTYIIIKLRK